jgi:hypothetical protein
MATIFCDHEGVLLVDFLDCGDTATTGHYCATLERLQQVIVTEGLCGWEITDFLSLNSSNLTPTDVHLFGYCKKHLAAK